MERLFPIKFQFLQGSGQLNWGLRYYRLLLGKRKMTSYLTTVAKSMLLSLVLTMEKVRYKEGSTSCAFQSSSKSPKFINIRTVVLGRTKGLFIPVSFLQMHLNYVCGKSMKPFPPYTLPALCGLSMSWCKACTHTIIFLAAIKQSLIPQFPQFINSWGLWSSLL